MKRHKTVHRNIINMCRSRGNGYLRWFRFDNEDDKKDIAKVIEKFEAFCIGKTNETFERYTFNICVQQESETIDAYVSKLRKLAKTCNYGELEESLIRDRIVC